MKNLKIEPQKANDILNTLIKYKLVYSKQIEMDDEIQTVYNFSPTASFIGLLIFAREIIYRPQVYAYHCQNRKKPYLV